MARTYYTNLSDIDLAREAVAKNPDLYLQYYEYIGSGVYSETTSTDATLTPSTSPSWTADEFISSTARNLLIVDDNSVVATALITDNDADSVTFNSTGCLLESDGVTPASFTSSSTYDFYVLSPSNSYAYGPFMGYVEGAELNLTDEMMTFKHSIPRKTKFQDLAERTGQITGGQVTFVNEDIIFSLFGADTYGSQTSQYAYGIGSEPDTDRFYRITMLTQDRNQRALTIVCRKVQFALNGNQLGKSESGHIMVPFTANILSDDFYPAADDMIHVIRAD